MGMVIFHGVIMYVLNQPTPEDFGDEEKHQATYKHLITFYICLHWYLTTKFGHTVS